MSTDEESFYWLGEGLMGGTVYRVLNLEDPSISYALKLYEFDNSAIYENDLRVLGVLNLKAAEVGGAGFDFVRARKGPIDLSMILNYVKGKDLRKLIHEGEGEQWVEELRRLYRERTQQYRDWIQKHFKVTKVYETEFLGEPELQMRFLDPDTGDELKIVLKIDNVVVPGTSPPPGFPMTIIDPF